MAQANDVRIDRAVAKRLQRIRLSQDRDQEEANAATAAERQARIDEAMKDFESFCGLLDIIDKQGNRIKFRFNHIQRLFNVSRSGRDVVLKPRQIGFTTLEQARDVFYFLTVPNAVVQVVCQSMTDNTPIRLLSKNYKVMFEGLRREGVKLNFGTESLTEWTLPDRNSTLRIVRAGASENAASKSGRAGTINRLHLTETAYYEYAASTLNALLECVPIGGNTEIVSESTPNGAAGYFYDQCETAKAGRGQYNFHFYEWFKQEEYQLPLEPGDVIKPADDKEVLLVARGITPAQLKWYQVKRTEKKDDLLDQEYPSDPETCFLLSGRAFFNQLTLKKLLDAAEDPIEERKSGRVRIYAKPIPGEQYLLSLDASEGVGAHPSGAIMYRVSNAEHVATIDGQFEPHDAAAAGVELCKEYNNARFAPERNNHGHAVLQAAIKIEKYPRVYMHSDDKRGWPTNPVTRPIMLDSLESAVAKGHFTTKDKFLLAQMRKFIVNDNGKPEASPGEHDDLVISAAIGWEVRSRKSIRGPLPELESVL